MSEEEYKDVFPPHVDTSGITQVQESPRRSVAKSLEEVHALLVGGKKREVKQSVRDNYWPLNSSLRPKLWKLLSLQHATDKNMQEGFYWDLVNQLFGSTDVPEKGIVLPPFVEGQHKHSYHLDKRGVKIVERIVCVLGFACPDITFSPTLYPVAALLLHYMSEEDCYNSLTALVGSKSLVFIPQTKLLYEVTWRTVMNITKKYAKSAGAHLSRHCSTSRAERIYIDWIWWILDGIPFNHLVRVMDCYLHEGIKVLYRVAMAILLLFQKHSSNTTSVWSKELQERGVDLALINFCADLPVTPRKLLRTAFGIRGLSSGYIRRVFLKTEMTLKSSKNVLNPARQLSRSRSSENIPNSQSQVNIQMMSHTLTIRELFTLWSWLPVRITMYQPILLYTTEEHGCSLTTFYFRVEHHEQTLLMIKTINNEVFGAYCSSRWVERNQKDERGNRTAYFGTGETFLFSLQPERAKYPWVGIDSNVDHSAELFMAADSNMITIGGGEGQAIWMDENIRFGKTDHCLTFNNPPLCTSRDFEIRVLEVYGFGGTT